MTPVTGIVRNGRIEIDAPNGCLEGAEVRLWLEATEASASRMMYIRPKRLIATKKKASTSLN